MEMLMVVMERQVVIKKFATSRALRIQVKFAVAQKQIRYISQVAPRALRPQQQILIILLQVIYFLTSSYTSEN